MNTRDIVQALAVIAGTALIITGLSKSYPAAIAGAVLIVLGLLGHFFGRVRG